MKVLIDLCIVPLGVGGSLSQYIAACEKVPTLMNIFWYIWE